MKKYIFILISILIFISCEDILIEKPKRFIAPSEYYNTEEEIEAALFGVYNYLNRTEIAECDWMHFGDAGTDVQRTRNTARHVFQYAMMDIIPNEYESYWRQYYKAIGDANLLLSKIKGNNEISEVFKKRIVAETKFLRAFFYFHLNLLWGNVPIWLEELNLDEVESLTNTPADEVRQQIIKDLVDASNDLPSTAQAGRVTQWAVKGLLARIYLFDKQWEMAKKTAKDVIDNSPHTLVPDVKELYDWKNKNNKEMIHIVPKVAKINPSTIHSFASPRPNDETINYPSGHSAIRPDGILTKDNRSRNPGSLFQGWGMYQCVKEHYDSFEEGDTRKDLWWHEISFTDGSTYTFTGGGSIELKGRSGYYALKWIAWDEATNDGGRDTYLMRLAELYLIYAEAENELNGPTNEAFEAINMVRRRAFGDTDHDLSGLSKEQFNQAIIDENRWELGGEGLRRWYLWHWGFDVYKMAAESVKLSNPDLASNLKPHHVYFRIPDSEIAKNPNLKQNPGYN